MAHFDEALVCRLFGCAGARYSSHVTRGFMLVVIRAACAFSVVCCASLLTV